MPLALTCLSHSPLLEVAEPEPALRAELDGAFARARAFVAEFDPELVVLFAPDHYNGFFYDLMPQFAVGFAARSIGDYGGLAGPLDVPRDIAEECAEAALDAGLDVAVSLRMVVDHGVEQPLALLFGALDAVPVVPVFVNAVAPPFGPLRRARALGAAIGAHLATRPERVLVVGSGGLSHDPPVPRLAGAAPDVVERLIDNRNPTADERAARERRTADAARAFATGTGSLQPLNPAWDTALLDLLGENRLAELDGWTNAQVRAEGGGSAQEVRTWIAAYAALAAAGPFRVTSRYYRPIPELIAGFGVTCALPA